MKLYLTFTLAFLIGHFGFSQCTVSINTTPTTIDCGDCFTLSALGKEDAFTYIEDFNDLNFEPWILVDSMMFYFNPCGTPLDGSAAAWFSPYVPLPRNIATQSFDFSNGGVVCYEMKLGEQSGAGFCDGPDDPSEGVHLQYSIDGGNNWIDFQYIAPVFGVSSPLDQWNNYCDTLPAAAETPNTMIRWVMLSVTSQDYDFWGLDNINISIPVNNTDFYYYDWFIDGSTNSADTVICQSSSSEDYNVMFTNGINDTCFTSIQVQDSSALLNVDFLLPNDTVCVGDIIDFSGSASSGAQFYEWTFSGATPMLASGENVSTMYYTEGTHTVQLIIENDCNETDTLIQNIVAVSQANCTNSLTDLESESIKIYYSSNEDRIVLNSLKTGEIYVLNSAGQKVIQSQVVNSDESFIETKSLTKGIYFAVFKEKNSHPLSRKFVK